MITKQPKVFLYSHTEMPQKNIGLAVSAWHSDDFYEKEEDMSIAEAEEFCDAGLKAFHKVAMEYVQTNWVIKNVSRAFQQQLTRTRLASYSIQSMRIVLKTGFARGGHYTMPPGLTDDQKINYHRIMLNTEMEYDQMIARGMKVEDARGILPLNIHSDISMSINLNALYHMISQRFCVLTQWEFRQVATQMKEIIRVRLGEKFSAKMDAPCVKTRNCPMKDEFCGTSVWMLDEGQRVDFYKGFISK